MVSILAGMQQWWWSPCLRRWGCLASLVFLFYVSAQSGVATPDQYCAIVGLPGRDVNMHELAQ